MYRTGFRKKQRILELAIDIILKEVTMLISGQQDGLTLSFSYFNILYSKFQSCICFNKNGSSNTRLFTICQVLTLVHLAKAGLRPHQLDKMIPPSFDPKYLDKFLEPDSEEYRNIKCPKYWHVKETVSQFHLIIDRTK